MSYNVFKDLVTDVDHTATCSEYKCVVISLIKENLHTIRDVYVSNGTITVDAYNILLNDARNDLGKASIYLGTDDEWKFDYVSFERYVMGVFKRVLWARMDYEDVKKVRNTLKE